MLQLHSTERETLRRDVQQKEEKIKEIESLVASTTARWEAAEEVIKKQESKKRRDLESFKKQNELISSLQNEMRHKDAQHEEAVEGWKQKYDTLALRLQKAESATVTPIEDLTARIGELEQEILSLRQGQASDGGTPLAMDTAVTPQGRDDSSNESDESYVVVGQDTALGVTKASRKDESVATSRAEAGGHFPDVDDADRSTSDGKGNDRMLPTERSAYVV